jgi:enoyl-CoA hydratase/carnithine racemase
LTGGTLAASDANRLGLVNRVVQAGSVLHAARLLANEIAANPTVSVEQTRAVVVASAERGEDHAWSVNAAAMTAVQASDDYAEGPRAFLERREPRWSGR